MSGWMAFDAGRGPEEGAVLCFAGTASEARSLGLRWLRDWAGSESVDDVAVDRLGDQCEYWTTYPLTTEGLCPDCHDEEDNQC